MRGWRWHTLAFTLLCLTVWPWRASARELSGIWLNVPYARQPKDGCGAASISMILRYWSLKDPEFKPRLPGIDEIQRKLFSPKAHGIFAHDMESYLRRNGLRVYVFRGNLQMLRDHLSKGRPLIVCLQEGRWLHYVVVVGLDPAKNVVLVNDPAGEKLEPLPRAKFEKKWRAKDNWTLLAVPEPAR